MLLRSVVIAIAKRITFNISFMATYVPATWQFGGVILTDNHSASIVYGAITKKTLFTEVFKK